MRRYETGPDPQRIGFTTAPRVAAAEIGRRSICRSGTEAQLIANGEFLAALGEITLKDENGKDAEFSYCGVWRFENDRGRAEGVCHRLTLNA